MVASPESVDVGVRAKSRNDFDDLVRLVQGEGLLDRRHGYYAVKVTLTLLALVGGCVAFAVLGDSWWQLATAVFFAVVFAQIAFLGHDAGHNQIFRTGQANDRAGYAFGAVVGMSYGWWMGKHRRHHANPNHEGDDPDIDIPLLAFTRGQSAGKSGFVRLQPGGRPWAAHPNEDLARGRPRPGAPAVFGWFGTTPAGRGGRGGRGGRAVVLQRQEREEHEPAHRDPVKRPLLRAGP